MKIIILLITIHFGLHAFSSIKTLKYESGISIYGQIGFVDLMYEENHDLHTYKMHAKTTSIGAVKFLSSNRIDSFTSEGKIVDGIYIPLKFIRHTSKNNYNKKRIYIFDYENKKVIKTEVFSKLETISNFDMASMSFKDSEQTVTKTSTKDIDFAVNDFLSLYLNFTRNNLEKGEVTYVDIKDKDNLIFVDTNLFAIHKNYGEDKYNILMIKDSSSIFFEKVFSVGISFYGDAYIKKISESTQNIY